MYIYIYIYIYICFLIVLVMLRCVARRYQGGGLTLLESYRGCCWRRYDAKPGIGKENSASLMTSLDASRMYDLNMNAGINSDDWEQTSWQPGNRPGEGWRVNWQPGKTGSGARWVSYPNCMLCEEQPENATTYLNASYPRGVPRGGGGRDLQLNGFNRIER